MMKKFVQRLKTYIENRRADRDMDHDPWWVTLMLDVGRPLVAILILMMCAPGEHYLAVQAGWSETLAWGMPGALTAYAGIAAVVATKRPKGAPGRKTAIWGAILSILLAMAAQPIAHLYGKTDLGPQQIALVIAVSCIPAAVFGHLLHMGAASPKPVRRTVRTDTAPVRKPRRPAPLPVPDSVPVLSGGHPDSGRTVADTRRTVADSFELPMEIVIGQPDGQEKKAMSSTDVVRPIKSANVSTLVREYLSKHPDASDADLSGHVRARKPDAKWDTIRKARDRFKETQEQTG